MALTGGGLFQPGPATAVSQVFKIAPLASLPPAWWILFRGLGGGPLCAWGNCYMLTAPVECQTSLNFVSPKTMDPKWRTCAQNRLWITKQHKDPEARRWWIWASLRWFSVGHQTSFSATRSRSSSHTPLWSKRGRAFWPSAAEPACLRDPCLIALHCSEAAAEPDKTVRAGRIVSSILKLFKPGSQQKPSDSGYVPA